MTIVDKIKAISKITNRSLAQSAGLLELCDDNFDKLIVLEQKILDNYIEYYPTQKRDVVRIMNLPRAIESQFSVRKEYEFELNKKYQSVKQVKTNYSNICSEFTDKWEHYAG